MIARNEDFFRRAPDRDAMPWSIAFEDFVQSVVDAVNAWNVTVSLGDFVLFDPDDDDPEGDADE